MLKINYQLKMQNYNIVNLYDSIIKENMYAWGINKGGKREGNMQKKNKK